MNPALRPLPGRPARPTPAALLGLLTVGWGLLASPGAQAGAGRPEGQAGSHARGLSAAEAERAVLAPRRLAPLAALSSPATAGANLAGATASTSIQTSTHTVSGAEPGPSAALAARQVAALPPTTATALAPATATATATAPAPAPAPAPGAPPPPAGPLSADSLAGGAELPAALDGQVQRLLGQAAGASLAGSGAALRLEVQPGKLDPRLRLAPCARVEAYLPQGVKPMGATRVGLRCLEGATHWNVFLPVTVRLWGKAVVAQATLPVGTVLGAEHLAEAEVDLAAGTELPLLRPEGLTGRTLARTLAAGEALRPADLAQRRWFAAGDTVKLVAMGPGFAINGEGQALSPGFDGQAIRVRTEGGRIVTGTAAGPHRVELRP